MQLRPGYHYYCQFPNRLLPGFLVKVEDVLPATADEYLEELGPDRTVAIISINGERGRVNTAWFKEATVDEWRLADAFGRLNWSRVKQIKWCNRLFPLRRGSAWLLANRLYGTNSYSSCVCSSWNSQQWRIAADRAEKIARRVCKLETTFRHPLNKRG